MEEIEVWLARNYYNTLIGCLQKPIKDKDGFWESDEFFYLPEDSFPNIKWEDKEPTKAKIILNK